MSTEGSTPDFIQEAHLRSLEDGSGRSPYEARAYVDPSTSGLEGSRELPPYIVPHRSPRPLGRAVLNESGREHARRFANEDAEINPIQPEEQTEINRGGRALVEDALDLALGKDRKIKAIEAEVAEMIPIDPDNVEASVVARERLVTARLRRHFDS